MNEEGAECTTPTAVPADSLNQAVSALHATDEAAPDCVEIRLTRGAVRTVISIQGGERVRHRDHTPNGRRRVARAGTCKSVPFRRRSISVSRRSSAGKVSCSLRRCCRSRATSSPSRRISVASAAGQRLGTPRFRPAPTRAPPWAKRGLETLSTVITLFPCRRGSRSDYARSGSAISSIFSWAGGR